MSLAWLLQIIDLVLPEPSLLDRSLALLPRTLMGLVNIFTSPFAHGDFAHLVSNTVPWLALGVVVWLGDRKSFAKTTVGLIFFSGLGTWLIGRGSFHLGASGLVYGYFGYVIGRAWYQRKLGWMIAAFLCLLGFGGMVWGVVPTGGTISWEGHLCGLVAGWYLSRQSARVEKEVP